MSPYQQIFSTNAILSVWRNLRNNRDPNDLLVSLQYHPEDVRVPKTTRKGKGAVVDTINERGDPRAIDAAGRSIGFVVPWRSMQAQRSALDEREKELAEALVMLAGEVAFTDLPSSLQSSLTHNPLVQVRHLAAGISRQMSKIDLQMAENAPFAVGKNLYTGGEIARKFLPPIQMLFEQRPVPQRMIFELLMELKDLVYAGMAYCSKEVLEWELDGTGTGALEELDDALVKAITPQAQELNSHMAEAIGTANTVAPAAKSLLKRKISTLSLKSSSTSQIQRPPTSSSPSALQPFLLTSSPADLLYTLESLETTATALTHLALPLPDFCAHSIITLRRLASRQTLADFGAGKKRRSERCAEYARCMKWAGITWRQGGGCRRGCQNEDEDDEALPSWHRSSRWFEEARRGKVLLGGQSRSEGRGRSTGELLR